jgi:hypothetical protein
MQNYLTRKKTLMGKRYEVEVPLAQCGGAIVRIHAVPDLELARIEDRTGYKLEHALAAISSQDLTEEEIKVLKENAAGPELIGKGAKALSPKLTLFLGEIIKAAMIPDPNCSFRGKGCEECNLSNIVEDLRSFSVPTLGMAAIGASTASWKDIEDFFSAPKEPSGAESSA